MPEAPDTDTDTDQGPVFRLIYNSHSRIALDESSAVLGEIFTTARRNNRRLGITGALIVSAQAFAQALEGEEAMVRDLYDRIRQDTRHERVTVVAEGVVDHRTFGRWAVAKVAENGGPDIRLLSKASAGKIVAAGADHHVTPEQEQVLAFMRGQVAEDSIIA